MKPSLQYFILIVAFAALLEEWKYGYIFHRPPCQPVHFDTLKAIKREGDNLYFSSRGIHLGTRRGCYVTQVAEKDFKINYPEAYSLWLYGMRIAPDDEAEEVEGNHQVPHRWNQ